MQLAGLTSPPKKHRCQKQIAAALLVAYKKRCSVMKPRNLKITQEIVARKLGVSQSLISQYFAGDLPIPDAKLQIFCDFLRIRPVDIDPNFQSTPEKHKSKFFVLDTGNCGQEFLNSEAYYEESLGHLIGIKTKYTADIRLLEDGKIVYEHGGVLQAFLHLTFVDALSKEELKKVNLVAVSRWKDYKKQIPGQFLFMRKNTYLAKLAKQKQMEKEQIVDFNERRQWGPCMAVLQIILK